MNINVTHSVLAVITAPESDDWIVTGGGAPIFGIRDEGERERVARDLGIIMLGNVHDLGNGTYIIVKH